ncbi:hypothetical protein GWK47_025386 [Chionoecetes opilio]|uniref:Uncharacterized protein n=1 Tax=Chionoecetes opilio TaxID=41210 RepID=A0A8J8WFN5_CHIOP|nr:hypothetical protein GWK47_025386 [Chionoecetes opilio]
MAPHHEVAAAGPARRLADKEKPAKTESGGTQGGGQQRESEWYRWASVQRFARHAVVAARRGTSGAFCPASPPGRRSSAHPSFELHPYLRCSDRWGRGKRGGARLPVVISCSPPRANVSLHSSGGHGGASVCGGSPMLGASGIIPTSAPGYTHDRHPRLPGAACDPGNHHLSGLRGTVSTTECIYIAEGVQQLYLSLKACKALRRVLTPSAPPFTHQWGVLSSHQTPHKTHVARNRHLTNL